MKNLDNLRRGDTVTVKGRGFWRFVKTVGDKVIVEREGHVTFHTIVVHRNDVS